MEESLHKKEKEAARLIVDAMREALRTLACEADNAKRLLANDAEKAVKIIEVDKKADSASVSSFIYKQLSFSLSIIGIVIGAFIYLTDPTKDNNTALQLQDQRITGQQQIIDGLTKTAQNDTKEVKSEMVGLRQEMQAQTNKIVELSTIISERIPQIKK